MATAARAIIGEGYRGRVAKYFFAEHQCDIRYPPESHDSRRTRI